jgi:hypothetical protein
LSAQAMEIVRTKDTGTLQYDIYLNDDQTECMVVERYLDSEALIEHGKHHRSTARGQQKGRSEDRPLVLRPYGLLTLMTYLSLTFFTELVCEVDPAWLVAVTVQV